MDSAARLKQRLKSIGLSDRAIDAAWPDWWSDDAELSTSAQTELRFSLARKLGLDARSLLGDNSEPTFVWRDEARFKHLSAETPVEKAGLASFGAALSGFLIAATTPTAFVESWDAAGLRNMLLGSQPYVQLNNLLSFCWAVGIPVAHLRVFPFFGKRMAAMSVSQGGRSCVLIGKDSTYPPHIAFYLAHELGHIALGHLLDRPLLIDLDSPELASPKDDEEESSADQFALAVLTGRVSPVVLPERGYNAVELARVATAAAAELRIEPGTLALCFGYSTGDWATANAAIKRIYAEQKPAWMEINRLALHQLSESAVPSDAMGYIRAVLEAPSLQ